MPLLALLADARSILDFPYEVRESNVVRLTKQSCTECATMESFYKDNELVFVLFYERALVHQHQYKTAIVSGFHSTCKELSWSRVACGVVDMVEDKDYAERYIDPSTAPAHILVRQGQPIEMPKEHVKKLMDKPGDTKVMLWHIKKLLSPTSHQISYQQFDQKAMEGDRWKFDLIVAGIQGQPNTTATFRAAVQRAVLTGVVPTEVPKLDMKESKKEAKRRTIRFAELTYVNVDSSSVLGYASGVPTPLAQSIDSTDDMKKKELDTVEAIKSIVSDAVKRLKQVAKKQDL